MKISKNLDRDDPLLKTIKLGPHPMPGIWAYYLPVEFLNFELPEEEYSTCMNCPKISQDGWHDDYRCCTYHPRVPNYSLGLSLHTTSGSDILTKAKDLGFLTPEGMSHTPQQYVDFLRDQEDDRFGTSDKVLCPFLQRSTGHCGIHAFRNSVCSTYFCINDHGNSGESFWGSLQLLVGQIETALSQWCLNELAFDLDSYISKLNHIGKNIKNVSSKTNSGFSPASLNHLWGKNSEKEFEFYKRCASLISDHRDMLWDIALDFEIMDAEIYDLEILKNVPKDLAHHINDEEWEIGVGSMSIKELWAGVQKSYDRLWHIPTYPLTLNPKAEITLNDGNSPTELAFKHQPFKLIIKGNGKNTRDELAFFLSAEEKGVLESLRQPQIIGRHFLLKPECKRLAKPRQFLQKVFAKNVLVKRVQ